MKARVIEGDEQYDATVIVFRHPDPDPMTPGEAWTLLGVGVAGLVAIIAGLVLVEWESDRQRKRDFEKRQKERMEYYRQQERRRRDGQPPLPPFMDGMPIRR